MNQGVKKMLVATFAIIGVCAVLYFCWQTYQQRLQEERARAFVTETPQAYKPGIAPPPPQ